MGHPEANVVIAGDEITVSNLAAGTYALEVTTVPDDDHRQVSKNTSVVVKKMGTVCAASKVITTYGSAKNLVVTLKDAKGNILVGKSIEVKLNNKVYNGITNDKGQVTVKVPAGWAVKTYSAAIAFAGDVNFTKYSKSVSVVVKKATPKLTVAKKTFRISLKTKKYTVTLKTDKKKPLKGGKITLKINKKTYSAFTNSKGQATFKITKLNKRGTFAATVKFVGNKSYNPVTKKVIITIKNK